MNYENCKKLRLDPRFDPYSGEILTIERYEELINECNDIEKEILKGSNFFDKFILYKDDSIFHYRAYPITIISYLFYLKEKYNTCDTPYYKYIYIAKYNIRSKHLHIEDYNIDECKNIMIGILFIEDDILKQYHGNAIIINKNTMTIEKFEPHGSSIRWYDIKDLDNSLETYAKSKNMAYTNIYDSCISLQTLEDVFPDVSGNCSIWSFWYIEYRLNHPNLTKEEIEKDFNTLYLYDSLLLHKMIVYLGKKIINTKLELYKYIISDVDMNISYIRVIYEMYNELNIGNKHILSDIINELESEITIEEIEMYIKYYILDH